MENTAEKIEVKCGIYIHELTKEEIGKQIQNIDFLNRAVLMLVNPEFVAKTDAADFDSKTYMKYLKEYFLEETNFSKDFIESVFKDR